STPPSLADGHLFGTDALGRDLFVRVMRAGQVSLAVGIAATLISVLIGVAWGAFSGFMGGRVDAVMMRIVDILYAMPFLFFVILLMVFFGRQLWLLFLAIGAVIWLDMARIVRGQTLALKQREFIAAARLAGLGPLAIIRRHILPNLGGLVVVYATLTVPQAILVESFLSFLGLGVAPPATSWGALVNEAVAQLEAAPWLLLFPGSLLALTLFCFNFLGDGLRDWLDTDQAR
ncbi:MAG TPA: ABC transporter permease subunit, partial [Gammaproteobacteria bacterium]|nr:ABC transporter permease subunit [Gammaproteobacteria bacterium]